MSDDRSIDPRYAAQFQRGFDPAVHTPPPPAPRSGPPRLPGGPVASADPVPPPPPFVARDEPAASAEESTPETPAPTAAWRSRLVEWSLPAVALVLALAAAALFGDMVSDSRLFYGYSDAESYAWTQVRASLPGPLLVGAALAITVWIVLRALRPGGSPR
jgi:hypothetical protein